MVIRTTTIARPQRRHDHRLRDLVQRTGDVTIATDLGVPRSTARGWLAAPPTAVVSVDVADLTETELRQAILKLRQRVEKLAALLRLVLTLLHTSGFTLSGARLPDGEAKLRILRAVDRLPSVSSYERFSGSCIYLQVGFTPGVDASSPACSTIGRPALGRHRID